MPLIDLLGDFGLQLAGGEVVHEEQRRGALHGDVVDAVVHQVGAHGVVQAHLEGDLELGAHAVHAARPAPGRDTFLVQREQAAEAADIAEDVVVEGLVREILDALLGAVGALDVHAGVGVGDAGGLCRVLLSQDPRPVLKWGMPRRGVKTAIVASLLIVAEVRRRGRRGAGVAERRLCYNAQSAMRRTASGRGALASAACFLQFFPAESGSGSAW